MWVWVEKSQSPSRSPCGGLSLPEHPYGHSPWVPSCQATPCTHHRSLFQMLAPPEGGAEKGWRGWISSHKEGPSLRAQRPLLYKFSAGCRDVAGVTKALTRPYLSGLLTSAFFSVGDIVNIPRDYRHKMSASLSYPHMSQKIFIITSRSSHDVSRRNSRQRSQSNQSLSEIQ